MKTIWKFPLEIVDSQLIKMPVGAEILTAQFQGETLCLWAMVDVADVRDSTKDIDRVIEIFGTGDPVWTNIRKYISTVQQREFVWHVFEAL